jgi:tetratricopeptide (TPR) repeat protein
MSLTRASLLLGTSLLCTPAVAAGPDAINPPALVLGKPAATKEAAPPARPSAGLGQPLRLQRARPAAREAEAAPKPGVDESALRYYVSTGDSTRVMAEIARLRAAHPGWTPPETLFVGTVMLDEQPVWDLFAAGRFADAKDLIERMMAENPGYAPSLDLAGKLDRALARADLVAASDEGDAERVLRIAETTEGLLVCREMDVLWRVAKAFAESGDDEQSVGVYRYVLGQCEDPKERLATVQKASQHLSPPDIDALLAMGRRKPDGKGEFESVRLDLVRRAVGRFAAGTATDAPAERDLKLLENLARAKGGGADAQLLGWYHYARKSNEQALDFFKIAAAGGSDPKAVEGQVLVLRNLGRTAEAMALAKDNLTRSPEIRKLFVEAVSAELTGPNAAAVDPALVPVLATAVAQERSALGAQSLGWYHFNRSADADAKLYFARSLDYGANPEAALGLALTAHRLGEVETARKIAKQYRDNPMFASLTWLDGKPAANSTVTRRAQKDRGRDRRDPGLSATEREAYALHDAGRFQEARMLLDGLAAKRSTSYGSEVVRAWAHYNSGSYDTARQLFAKLDKQKSTRDTRHGAFLAENAYYGRKIW